MTKLKVDSQEGYKLWVAIDAVYHNLMRGREQEFAEVKIKPMHAVVIAVIKNGSGALSPAQISRRIFRGEEVRFNVCAGIVNCYIVGFAFS